MLPTWLQTVHHDGSEKYVSELYPRFGDRVRLRLRVSENAPVRSVLLRTTPDGEQAFTQMTPAEHTAPARWWEVELAITQPVVDYRFLLQADDGLWTYSAAGPSDYDQLDANNFRILADYDSPAWLQDAVFYQIFPDSFANGDPGNDPQPDDYVYRGKRPKTFPWGSPIPVTRGEGFSLNFYGGDLKGVLDHLDHLERLGVTAIYLNPVFTAYSNHRYDPIDYTHVDPRLGGDEALIALREALTARNMRYILDITPNHCGVEHPWLKAAQADPNASEAEYFTFTQHPDDYLSWLGHKTLPKLNYNSTALRRRIYEDDNAIFRRWLRPPFDADGWRVDVGNMMARQGRSQLNGEIARGIRRAVKDTRPDAYLMAENFFDATAQLQGNQWDAVMNYMGMSSPLAYWLSTFAQEAIGFKGKITSPVPYPTTALEATWRYRRAAIPWAIALQQYNLLGSHDTARIRSTVEHNDALHRLAVVVQMTFPGVPGVYYGDEIGLVNDPAIRGRAAMIWDEERWNRDLFEFHRDLIALRRQSVTLQRGGFQMLATDPDTFAYQRESFAGRVIVVAHRGETPRPAGSLTVAHGGIADGARFVEHFSQQEAVVVNGALPLPELPQGATLWEQVE